MKKRFNIVLKRRKDLSKKYAHSISNRENRNVYKEVFLNRSIVANLAGTDIDLSLRR